MSRSSRSAEPITPGAVRGHGVYAGATFALLTQHGKESVFEPRLRSAFRAEVELVEGFDTDSLGSFTREVPRAGSQLEAARRKAALAIELSGQAFGLGSEGSFMPGPLGLGSINQELVVLKDAACEVEIVGRSTRPGRSGHGRVGSVEQLYTESGRLGFPEHALALRPATTSGAPEDRRIRKGLADWGELERAFLAARAESAVGDVLVETDLRAHRNPTRMANIAAAVDDLIERMRRRCARCGAPGFGRSKQVLGLPCASCGGPTSLPLAEEYECVACDHRELRELAGPSRAEPGDCPVCNP